MHNRKRVIQRYALLLICATASPAWAAFDETYKLYIGGSITNFDTTLRVNSRDESIDEEIELEEGLGFDSSLRLGFVRGFWRMAERHRLSLVYAPIRRTSEFTSVNDINIGGNIIEAGAFIGSSVRTHVFDLEYLYSFFKRPNIEIGFTAGLYWMNSVAELAAAGEIIIEGENQPLFRSDYRADQRLIAPLPLIGLTAGYEFNDNWRVTAAARFFDVTINDIEGYLASASLGAEYYFTDHVGMGTSLSWFDVSVRHNGVVFINKLTYEYAGFNAYLALKY